MDFGMIFLLAIGLAMDATAVAAVRGFAAERIQGRHVLTVALAFGGFQALMPAIGWVMGSRLGATLQTWDHWIAFGLLAGIGGRMLWEAAHQTSTELLGDRELFGLRVVFLLAIATSIDALAAGITLPMLKEPLVPSIAVIGIVTAILSAGGLFAGRRFGQLLGRRLDVVGGAVLIGLGCKILIQHLMT